MWLNLPQCCVISTFSVYAIGLLPTLWSESCYGLVRHFCTADGSWSCSSVQFTDAGLQHLGATHDGLGRVILRACPLISDNGAYVRELGGNG